MDEDILALLSYYRTHPLPEDENERISLLKQLTVCDVFYIYYEDVCKYSPFFKQIYPADQIRTLFRKYHIIGNDVPNEIEGSNATEEEKALMYFFFKGKYGKEE